MKNVCFYALMTLLLSGAPAAAGRNFVNMPAFGGYHELFAASNTACPNDAFMVGISGKNGDWVDRFQAICSRRTVGGSEPLLASQTVEPESSMGRSNGGSFEAARCPQGFAVVGFDFTTIGEGAGRVVNSIRIFCRKFTNYDDGPNFPFAHQDGGQALQTFCNAPFYAIGVDGLDSGKGPTQMGMRCARRLD